MKRFAKSIALLTVALVACVVLTGSALVQPPVDIRAFRFTIAGTPLTTADVDINFLRFNKGPSCSVVVINDNAAGGNEILFTLANNATSAAAGADGVAGSTTIPVLGGEKIYFDGRYTHCVIRSAAATSAARIFCLFDK